MWFYLKPLQVKPHEHQVPNACILEREIEKTKWIPSRWYILTPSRWYILPIATNPRSEEEGSLGFFRNMWKFM